MYTEVNDNHFVMIKTDTQIIIRRATNGKWYTAVRFKGVGSHHECLSIEDAKWRARLMLRDLQEMESTRHVGGME